MAFADQKNPQLPGLFDRLQNVSDSAEASQIESRIWAVWLEAPDERSSDLLQRVTDAMGQNDLREALIAGTELVESYPDYAEAWNKRATVYYLMANFDASVLDIQKTLQLEPRHFGAISGLGLIFNHQGNLKAALKAFEQVLVISPMSINAQRSVAELRERVGQEI